MEARQTVMNDNTKRQFRYIPNKPSKDVSKWDIESMLQAQAEQTESMLKEQWKQEGIREVVKALIMIDKEAYDVKDFTRRVCDLIVEWQAFLKEREVQDV